MNVKETITYIYGKRATFTISNLNRSKHFTYKRWNKHNTRFIGYLRSKKKYKYIGILNDDLYLIMTQKSPSITTPEVTVLNNALARLRAGELPPDGHIEHCDRCCMCGRKLTDPESLRTGVGPVCVERGNS